MQKQIAQSVSEAIPHFPPGIARLIAQFAQPHVQLPEHQFEQIIELGGRGCKLDVKTTSQTINARFSAGSDAVIAFNVITLPTVCQTGTVSMTVKWEPDTEIQAVGIGLVKDEYDLKDVVVDGSNHNGQLLYYISEKTYFLSHSMSRKLAKHGKTEYFGRVGTETPNQLTCNVDLDARRVRWQDDWRTGQWLNVLHAETRLDRLSIFFSVKLSTAIAIKLTVV
jgi:hypothetical protein